MVDEICLLSVVIFVYVFVIGIEIMYFEFYEIGDVFEIVE